MEYVNAITENSSETDVTKYLLFISFATNKVF